VASGVRFMVCLSVRLRCLKVRSALKNLFFFKKKKKNKNYLFGKKKLKVLLKVQNVEKWSKYNFCKSLKVKLLTKRAF
jgi:hypothetical protein